MSKDNKKSQANEPTLQKEPKKTQAQQIMEFAQERCKLYKDDQQNTYASFINQNGTNEIWSILSPSFKNAVGAWHYKQHGQAFTQDMLKDACGMLHSVALYSGDECTIHRRVAKIDDCYYLDLCDEQWQQVAVSAYGFRVVPMEQAMFARSQRMSSLPVPMQPNDLSELWDFFRVEPKDRNLLLAWILECFRVDTVYPILEVSGGQGTGKTMFCAFLKLLIDPAMPLQQPEVTTIEDLYVTAKNNHLVLLENLSSLNKAMQDACCQISTGSGYSKRKLHSNAEEYSYSVKTPLLINGIVPLATREDMISRTVRLKLTPISGGIRVTETSLMERFMEARPRLLGALLSLFSTVLSKQAKEEDYELPRLADFALLGEAISLNEGHRAGNFIKQLNENQADACLAGVEGDPFADTIIQMGEKSEKECVFSGTCGELLRKIQAKTQFPQSRHFPTSARGVKNCLQRHEAAFGHYGIWVEFPKRRKDGCPVVIYKKLNLGEHGEHGEHDEHVNLVSGRR